MKLNRRILSIVMAAALLLAGMSAFAETTIRVQGTGNVKVDADRVNISLGVREIADDVMTAQSAVNEKIAAVVEALKEMGLEKDAISTNGIGIYPNYNYDEGETITGYTAYNNIYLTLADVNNTGAYIDAAFAAGANSLDYVDFSAADTEAAAQRALVLAVDSAMDKARVLAEAAGLKLGQMLEISEDEKSGYDPGTVYAKNEEDAGMGAGTEVLASKQTVSATVVVTFAAE